MSAWTPSNEQRERERFWRTPPPDPTRACAKSGTPYYRPGRDRVLMPDDFMPFGPHAGKHMRAVPTDYLHWVNTQPWSKQWPHWQPIADYLDRHPERSESSEALAKDGQVIFLTSLHGLFAELHCLPGHEDKLHTFVLGTGVTDRSQFWDNPKYVEYPHYRLAARRLQLALDHGAKLIDATTRLAHIRQWRSQ